MKRVLIVASVISFIEWFEKDIISYLSEEMECEVQVACNCEYLNDTSKSRTEEFLEAYRQKGVLFHNIEFARSPFSTANFGAYREIRKLIVDGNFDIIHCHTPMASILTRFAARQVRKKGTKVVYTAHGFHFYRGAPILNWLIFYPIEKLCSNWTDELITINTEDYALAKKKFYCKSVHYIPGIGIDVDKFKNASVDVAAKRKELGICGDVAVVFSVGELNKNKNHVSVVRAIARINNKKIVYIIAGKGEGKKQLEDEIQRLGMNDCVKLLGFRCDIPELYKISDIFVFPSFREGLPASVMEAMAAGLPVVCSQIRGNVDLIEADKGGMLCKPDDIQSYINYLSCLISDSTKRQAFGSFNQTKIEKFSKSVVLDSHVSIYKRLLLAQEKPEQ